MYVCMDGWMDGCMHVCMDARMHACMHAWMHGCMDAWMHGCMHACMHVYKVHTSICWQPSIVNPQQVQANYKTILVTIVVGFYFSIFLVLAIYIYIYDMHVGTHKYRCVWMKLPAWQ